MFHHPFASSLCCLLFFTPPAPAKHSTVCLAPDKDRQEMPELVLCPLKQWSRDKIPEMLEQGASGTTLDLMQ